MTAADFLRRLAAFGDAPAWIDRGQTYTFAEVVAASEGEVGGDRVVALAGGHSFANLTTLLAHWRRHAIVALVGDRPERAEVADASMLLEHGNSVALGGRGLHPLYESLAGGPGVVIFTSGSSGLPKAALHRAEPWLAKVTRTGGRRQRTLAFLSFDHIGGLNTILYALAQGGTVIVPDARSPSEVWQAIREHEVELLPTTPTFLRLALLEGEIPPLPSLRLVAYGSEPMPEATLAAARRAMPGVEFLQQYGMSELGVLRSRSRGDGSNWMRLGGPEFGVRVVDGLLEVKAETAMVGYLNAPSPFTEDGWLRTGDEAEEDRDWIRIRGRRSETINVGGEKVHPVEVEAVLESLPGVQHACVRGEPNPILGQAVVAAVALEGEETAEAFRRRMRPLVVGRLPRHAIPLRIERLESATNDRAKKIRRKAA